LKIAKTFLYTSFQCTCRNSFRTVWWGMGS